MRALLVIDVQEGLVELGDFTNELQKMESMIQHFKANNEPVIFIQHFDEDEESTLHHAAPGSAIHESLTKYANEVVQKKTPSAFYQTNLGEILQSLAVNHLVIVGFNAEFCCMFTSIAAYDRGYRVSFIEDAIGTVNTGSNYGTDDLDVRDFIGTVLHWSNVIEVVVSKDFL